MNLHLIDLHQDQEISSSSGESMHVLSQLQRLSDLQLPRSKTFFMHRRKKDEYCKTLALAIIGFSLLHRCFPFLSPVSPFCSLLLSLPLLCCSLFLSYSLFFYHLSPTLLSSTQLLTLLSSLPLFSSLILSSYLPSPSFLPSVPLQDSQHRATPHGALDD